MPPKCENCLLPEKCPKPPSQITGCWKKVNKQLEPTIPLNVFINMVLGPSQKPQFGEEAKKAEVFPSISDLLVKGAVSPQQIAQFVPIEDSKGEIAGYQVEIKKHGTKFFLP